MPAAAGAAPDAPLFSVVVPSTGDPHRVGPFLDGLARQTLPRERWELVVVLDGVVPPSTLEARLAELGARIVTLPRRSGPPLARNAGAAVAHGTFLVSVDDDVVPEPDWLARAAAHLARDPSLDVIEGVTRKPGGRAVRIAGEEAHQYILCNLFVRRTAFEAVGGFRPEYFEHATGVFFREDADLGWSLEAAGARVVRGTDVVVVHPEENPRFWDPLRWTRRYVMDALLEARFPREFRERIEVHRIGPLRIRRPIVRAAMAYLVALALALVAAASGHRGAAEGLLVVAGLALLPLLAKWRFDLRRLPAIALVPFGLAWALARGQWRLRRLEAGRPATLSGSPRSGA